ncbi:MAG: 5'-methylthioadenosine/S-adenosylhomocysteine nucleosidase [Bacteroidales bacterium]|nr:5'-methylthioadenosine/S-adenosylhomocysteine nucleosidase [Bacteroidales bacterium]
MKVGIICAMQSELDLVSRADFGNRNEVRCFLSGMGKVNAALAAARLIHDFAPDCIINAGVAGSLRSEIREGAVVIGAETAYHDTWCGGSNPYGVIEGLPQRFQAHPVLLEAAVGCAPDLHCGLIITGDQFYIDEREDARQRRLYSDALAVDMESAAIAHACYLFIVPFLSFRIISDSHDDGHQLDNYTNFWNSLAQRSFVVIEKLLNALPDRI